MEAKTDTDLGAVLGEQLGEQVEGEMKDPGWPDSGLLVQGHMVCAICLEKILIQEMALVKGCEHAYCVTCILRWATYKENPSCPQCKLPFKFLNLHRSLDGRICDYMFEESVCLLLRASWFIPTITNEAADAQEEEEDISSYYYGNQIENEEVEDDEDESYFTMGSSNVRIGNRRWGDNGYVRAGRKEARPVNRRFAENSEAGPSRPSKKTEVSGGETTTGRRAKRALKREAAAAAAAAAAAKQQQNLLDQGHK